MRSSFVVLAAALVLPMPALGQHAEHGGGGDAAAAYVFPEVCRIPGQAARSAHAGHDTDGMEEHQKAAMEGMARMDADMMQGMMQKDADVAFICGMIAHHQGAIDMARVELEHGDDPWSKELAQRIIEAQTKEIAEMIDWLAKNAE